MPAALLLLKRDATVTVCHSATQVWRGGGRPGYMALHGESDMTEWSEAEGRG